MLLCATAMDRQAASRMRAETERTYAARGARESRLRPHGGGDSGRELSSGRLPSAYNYSSAAIFAETTLVQLARARERRPTQRGASPNLMEATNLTVWTQFGTQRVGIKRYGLKRKVVDRLTNRLKKRTCW
jgi:hypothetical protein